MKLKIEKKDLISLLSKTQNIVEKRNTMPVLVNVLFDAKKGSLKVFATDLEVSLTDETEAEVLSFAIASLRETFNSLSTEIIVPFEVEVFDPTITITIPKAGDKKKLLDLSLKNVNYYKEEIRKILDMNCSTQ